MFLLVSLTICSSAAWAQEQENKLMNRLLRPDMSLANSAQDKKFTGTGATSVEKKFVAREFYSGHEPTTKSFPDTRDFAARNFKAKKYTRAEKAANTKTNTEPAYAKTEFRTQESSLLRTSSAEGKVAKTREYAESSRPFLGQGTRQKILSQQDQPLTIEEVRELLNKGK
ncbi:MAG: hypothetical protein ABIR38_03945 [Chthoniobacterales bacterium]